VHGGVVGQALVGGIVFTVLVLARERLPGTLSLMGELKDILGFIRARRAARSAPAGPAT
ncbi:polysaccharide biosynthesis protein, partial [Pyxidicoccus fallax]|nr:polysaccharide biosynthesis protein [Pyxidicoccus fallax]NPC86559.1 polysaccharide biosynthesis protein [Pyxidicoccus fallax]